MIYHDISTINHSFFFFRKIILSDAEDRTVGPFKDLWLLRSVLASGHPKDPAGEPSGHFLGIWMK